MKERPFPASPLSRLCCTNRGSVRSLFRVQGALQSGLRAGKEVPDANTVGG
jgi:hypothetical protein